MRARIGKDSVGEQSTIMSAAESIGAAHEPLPKRVLRSVPKPPPPITYAPDVWARMVTYTNGMLCDVTGCKKLSTRFGGRCMKHVDMYGDARDPSLQKMAKGARQASTERANT
jgi:hypothetical protein